MLIWLLLIAFVAGCKSGGFRAASLPPEFAAPPARNSLRLDLSNLARATAQSEVIYPGDMIELTLATGLEEEKVSPQLLRVADNGFINLALIGPLRVAGLTLPQAEQRIYDASVRGGYYRNPQISLQVSERRTNQVMVMGEVEEPGVYDLPASGSDLLSAITMAGGLSQDADTVIEVRDPNAPLSPDAQVGPGLAHDAADAGAITQASYRRHRAPVPGPASGSPRGRSLQVNLAEASIGDGRDYSLSDGAVVMVMKRPKRAIQVIGLVNKPGQFEMPDDQDLRLLDALALAGGRPLKIADRVVVVRQVPERGDAILIKASVSKAKKNPAENIRLAAGDLVSIEETPLTFTLSTLKGLVNFGFSTGVRTFNP